MVPIKCGHCGQAFADKRNKAECVCVCHGRTPLVVQNDIGGQKWDYRRGRMVPATYEEERV